MSALFVMRRPGILVVSGLVQEIDGDTVVIENKCYLPVSQKEEPRRCRITFPSGKVGNLGLTAGAFVIASTKDDFRVEMFMEGGETPDQEYCLTGYQLRYNGSFDFDRHGSEKEEHVFAGNILSLKTGETASGHKWTKVRLAWKKKGQEEVRDIFYWGEDGDTLRDIQGSRVIFVCGEPKDSYVTRTEGTQTYRSKCGVHFNSFRFFA